MLSRSLPSGSLVISWAREQPPGEVGQPVCLQTHRENLDDGWFGGGMLGWRHRLSPMFLPNSLPSWMSTRDLRQMGLIYHRNGTKTDRRQASEPRALGDCAHTRCVANTDRRTATSTVPELPVVQSHGTQALLLSWAHGTPLRGTGRNKQSQWKGY